MVSVNNIRIHIQFTPQ